MSDGFETYDYPICYSFGHPINVQHININIGNIFNCNDMTNKQRVIITSDLHAKAPECFDILNDYDLLTDSIVICAGDMSGCGKKGDDADSVPLYKSILNKADKLYFVQGNHDLYNPEEETLKNTDDTFCLLNENNIVNTFMGNICGYSGIIATHHNKNVHKYDSDEYNNAIKNILKNDVDILVTHDTPRHINCNYEHVGCHIFGHCHLRNAFYRKGETIFINAIQGLLYLIFNV